MKKYEIKASSIIKLYLEFEAENMDDAMEIVIQNRPKLNLKVISDVNWIGGDEKDLDHMYEIDEVKEWKSDYSRSTKKKLRKLGSNYRGIRRCKMYEPIKIQTGTFEFEGNYVPIIETLSVTKQKEWIESGGTIVELIQLTLETA